MSEYQYYEFRAVDRPLTPDELARLRSLSTRAQITPTRLQNTYHYGDFRGNPRELVEKYFDAHVYVSNFGTVVLMLRLPGAALPGEELAPYAADDAVSWWSNGEQTIVEWRVDEEPSGDLVEGEGWMERLLPLREELAGGDYRSLYLGWLSSIRGWMGIEEGEWKDEEDADEWEAAEPGSGREELEPPVPAGLRALTPAQAALAEFLEVDLDLIEAAATASPDLPGGAAAAAAIGEWVARLPEEEVRTALARVLAGKGLAVPTELQSRYYRSAKASASAGASAGRRRSVAELIAQAGQGAREREQRKQEAAERERRERLAALVPRFPSLWDSVDAAAHRQNASGYEEACRLLVDLRDAYAEAGRTSEFEAAFGRFLTNHGRRTALRRRLAQVGLVSER